MRRSLAVLAAALALVVATPLAADAVRSPVRARFFGMHDTTLTSPLPYGAVRLWDMGVTWADVEPEPGRYDFTRLDLLVDEARGRGARVTLTLGATPAWAAADPSAASVAWLPRGSSSPPRADADWVDYVRTVATRYRGRIDSYQVWNEGSLPLFWSSTPARLARLTALAYPVVRAADPAARVVSTPMLPRQPTWRTWSTAYLHALRRHGWPVDVFAIHSYQPDRLASPDGRVRCIRRMQALLSEVHAPHRRMWDTEANYTSNAFGTRKVTGGRAAAWVARAFLDSLRLHVSRTYWYAWDRHVGHLGVRIADGTAGARGYRTVRRWLVGSRFRDCSRAKVRPHVRLTACTFHRDHSPFHVVWVTDGHRAPIATVDGPHHRVCTLLRGCRRTTPTTTVGSAPVLLR